jgi:membrane-associated phospholipid phosphatase
LRTATLTICLLVGIPAFAQVSDPPDTTAATTSIGGGDPRDRIYYPGDTERAVPLARKLVSNILLDQKEIWTSPFHMQAKDAKWWIGFGAVTAALVATDHSTSTVFKNSKGQVAWGNRISKIGASYTLVPLVAGFYGYGVLGDDSKAREVGVLGTEALLDSLIVVEILKPIAGRSRPDAHHEPGEFFDRGDSFPSGHAIESWSIASIVAHEYSKTKIVPVVAYGLASVVSLSRFAAQRHYASDIVAGGAMGWFLGRYVYQTHVTHAGHHHAWLHPQITPDVGFSSRSYGIALTFDLR